MRAVASTSPVQFRPALAATRHLADRMAVVLLVVLAAAVLAFGSDYWVLASQIAIFMLFAVSVDLLVGFAGIVTLGHAVFFGLGAYGFGLASLRLGWSEPLSGLLIGGLAAAVLAFATSLLVLRTRGLGQLMLTMAFAALMLEVANSLKSLTGGDDGLQNIVVAPILGRFEFDLYGRVAYIYAVAVLAGAMALIAAIIASPYGRSLVGIRENRTRMMAIGTNVTQRLQSAYVLSAFVAGIAGACLAQTTQFVGLNTLHFQSSGEALVMLALGGPGRLWGAALGAVMFMVLKDRLSTMEPAYWYFWLGLILTLTVLFAPRGLMGLLDALAARWLARGRA